MFPENLKECDRRRLLVTQRIPDQSVFVLNRKNDDLLSKLMECHKSKETKSQFLIF